MSNPSWRKIEAALIELLREEGFEIEYYKGESFTTIIPTEDEPHEINLADFARHLAERL